MNFIKVRYSLLLFKGNSAAISFFILLSLINKQPKINYLNLKKNFKKSYSIGLVLKILNIFKKSNRRSISSLKYVINFILKKDLLNQNDNNLINKGQNFGLIFKSLKKNFIKILYLFKNLVNMYRLNYIIFYPLKQFNFIKIKKIRSIKRRITKKLIEFNKI